jgi:TonB family protein
MKVMISHMWLENLASYSLQVAFLILAGTMLIHLFRLKAPVVLLAFWQTLLVLCLLLPILQPWRQVRQAIQSAAEPAVEIPALPTLPSLDAVPPVTTPALPRSIPFPTRGTIALILGAGIGLRFLWLALGMLRLHCYRHRSRRLWVLPESIRDLQWRVGVAPEVLLSRQIDSPVTFGWRRPAVLLPEAFTEMSESLQRPIACHELLHVERRDWLYIVSEETLRSFFWFHPGVWWALSRIHLSREQVVDREVLRITGSRGPYLESLLHIASLRGRPAAVPAPLLLHERHLVQRVALMLKESTMSKFRVTVSLATIAACLLAAGTLAAVWFPLTAPAAQLREPLQVDGSVMRSKLLRRVEPVYPETARRARLEGVVRLQVLVNELGEVSSVKIIGGGYPPLQPAAAEAVRQWRYSPTYLNGEPVPVLTTVNVTFSLTAEAGAVAPPPPPPADPNQAFRRDPIRVGGPVQEGKLIRRVDPVYPELAKQARLESVVILEVQVNEQGEVTNIRVIRGHPLLDQAAIEAVKQWRYHQTLLNGVAVPVITTVSVTFKLGGGSVFVAPAEQPQPAATGRVARREPLRIGGNVQDGKLIRRVDPEYPELARRARIDATVMLEVLVNEQGKVASVRVIRGHPALNQAATDAVKQWRYSQTLLNGEAVPVITTVSVSFKTGGGSAFVAPTEQPQQATAGQTTGREPLRVGGNVQDSKLIHRVDPEYPELARRARIEAMVMLEVLVNEQGEVANIRVIRGHPLLVQAAIDAVKQWRYSPTYLNGEAVPVIATQTVIFKLGGSGSEIRIIIDQDGSLKDLGGNPITGEAIREKQIVLQVPPESQASFAQINQTLRYFQEQGVQNVRLVATAYRFTAGRLFYAVAGPSNSPFPPPPAPGGYTRQIPDSGTSVQPAQLGIDLESLAAMAKSSGQALGNPGTTTTLGYTVYVTETGQIVAVDGGLPQLPEITAALRRAPVIAAGRRGNEPVPTAVGVTLSVRW